VGPMLIPSISILREQGRIALPYANYILFLSFFLLFLNGTRRSRRPKAGNHPLVFFRYLPHLFKTTVPDPLPPMHNRAPEHCFRHQVSFRPPLVDALKIYNTPSLLDSHLGSPQNLGLLSPFFLLSDARLSMIEVIHKAENLFFNPSFSFFLLCFFPNPAPLIKLCSSPLFFFREMLGARFLCMEFCSTPLSNPKNVSPSAFWIPPPCTSWRSVRSPHALTGFAFVQGFFPVCGVPSGPRVF